MQIFDNNLTEWRATRAELPEHMPLGFVPTMGNLHAGHMALIQQSLHENKKTVVTLFVNYAQFNQASDFENYPRTLEADLKKLKRAGVDYCLIPNQAKMYADDYRYQVSENKESLLLEGARAGHFTGVLTVVMKLFNLVKPTRAYFGEKDYQQLSLIEGMVDAFFLDIEVRACPTVREKSTLALSSRNHRLSLEGRKKADAFARIFHNAVSCEEAITELEKIGVTIKYIEEHQNRRFAAVLIDNIRLIDNYPLR
ncbi:MAG: pantoate--beta-alanine ligase [Gammaproteobacteria bacterium]|nr:pantoate--beta-alanine ligase [Gammaproteobacteria bacterium]